MQQILRVACVVGCLGLAAAPAGAQEVIHAMTGTIRSIDTANQSFVLFRDGGSLLTFKDMTGSRVPMAVDKGILPAPAEGRVSGKTNEYVIVFYYGLEDNPSAAAVETLGTGPFTATAGTVASFNEKDRSLSIKDSTGSIHDYKLTAATIAESDVGVVDGLKFHAEKGGHVRVIGKAAGGSPTAVFVNPM